MSSKEQIEPDPEVRKAMLRGMHAVSDNFYAGATRVGCHAFIEFCGLMNEFIKLCEEAEKEGTLWTHANVHSGTHLPFKQYHLDYINEKLECIFGDAVMMVRKKT